MMLRVFALLALLGLAACGADGEPVQPDGALTIGIGSGGVSAGASIGVTRGPLPVGVSLF